MEKKKNKALELIKNGERILKENNIELPRLDSEVILGDILRHERTDLYLKELNISKEDIKKFYNNISLRKEKMPVAYITGKREFFSLNFFLEKGVLIPRPETELLVEEGLNIANNKYGDKTVKIIEIGTGSGAIAVTLAKNIDKCEIFAVDISNKALELALKNAKYHQVEDKITFLKGDVFEPLNSVKADIIISNPPYIKSKELEILQEEIKKYEPILALDGGKDGLDFYYKIINESITNLSKGGYLLLEIGYNQGEEVKKIARDNGLYDSIKIIKDYSKNDRIFIAHLI